MKIEEIIEYWIKTSDEDYITMNSLFKSKRYSWSLFVGHLVIEKLLKALFVNIVNTKVPYTHNLLKLAELSKIELSTEKKDLLDKITQFNINTRYPDYKLSFHKQCNKKFTTYYINEIKKLRTWLKRKINK